jgi:hypothetical protein
VSEYPDTPSRLAAAVARGELTFDPPPGRSRPSQPFCGIGVCFECETVIDGRVVRLCMEPDADRG